jgi:anti-sigma factor RsiW
MNDETKIKIQAYLDGELSGRERTEISNLVSSNREAQSLLTELQFTKAALKGNELELKVPETREFYWSKIQREIGREAAQPAKTARFSWWKPVYFRFAGGLAAAFALMVMSFVAFNNGNPVYPIEVEGNGDDMGAITYHSESEQMTVVYLFDRETAK